MPGGDLLQQQRRRVIEWMILERRSSQLIPFCQPKFLMLLVSCLLSLVYLNLLQLNLGIGKLAGWLHIAFFFHRKFIRPCGIASTFGNLNANLCKLRNILPPQKKINWVVCCTAVQLVETNYTPNLAVLLSFRVFIVPAELIQIFSFSGLKTLTVAVSVAPKVRGISIRKEK